MREALEGFGMSVSEVSLGARTALVTEGDGHPAASLARLPAVEQVIQTETPAPLAAATLAGGGRPVSVGTTLFSAETLTIVAGPCTIEDAGTLREIAGLVKQAGADALRGGAYKVRTSPHQFQGGGIEALQELRAVSRECGLPFFTELNDPRQVSAVADLVDGVQIGARHMQNFPLLTEAAKLGKPILLKRHMSADLDEFLLAAEYILDAGNEQVILCERGIKSAERHVRYLLDVGAVPWLKERVGLPVIVDPSHAAGHHRLVPALARAAVAAGADGLIIEVHPRPEETRCDALQALSPTTFAQLVTDVRRLAALTGRRAGKVASDGGAAETGASGDGPVLRTAAEA